MRIHELGHVVLYVTDLSRAIHFYRDVLGFRMLFETVGAAAFSSGRTHHELLLIEVGGVAQTSPAPKPGLYHIGFKVGDTDDELREALRTMQENNVTIVGTADHTVTHSLYVLDPDGNELELYVDIGDEWKRNPGLIGEPTRPLRL